MLTSGVYSNCLFVARASTEASCAAEVTHLQGVRIAPDVAAARPAFDVTPARYITAVFTERGVATAPYTESLRKLAAAPAAGDVALIALFVA